MKNKIFLSSLTISTLLFTGCGGGGGGSSSPSGPSIPNNPGITKLGKPYWETNEYNISKLNKVGAWQAYDEGYTGKGVNVAVIDTGVNINHQDLDSKITNGISFNSFTYNETLSINQFDSNGLILGQVEDISINNNGSGYTTAPNVIINGDGSGAEAVAVINGSGEVTDVYITNHGNGYTNATLSIDNSGTGGSGLIIDSVNLAIIDTDGHGTYASSIIAREKNDYDNTVNATSVQGVAFESNIIPIKVFDNDGVGTVGQSLYGLNWAVDNNVDIINFSLGTNDSTAYDYNTALNVFRNTLDNDLSIVVSSGNEDLNCQEVGGSLNGQCSFPAALPWLSGNSDLLTRDGGWVIVGSVDDNNLISSFSNKAGVTASNYIVAPGENLIAANQNGSDTYSLVNGTSFSAPIVSGAMALMKDKFPHLKGNQIAQILFDTATDLGDVGIDSTYGNGLLNLEEAFKPIGTLSIPLSNNTNGNNVNLSTTNTGMAVPKIFKNTLSKSSLGFLNNTIALDDYKRDFKISVSNSVVDTDNIAFDFNNFKKAKFGDIILGFDDVNDNVMLGYTKNNKTLMFSYTDDYLGLKSEGLFDINNEQSYYLSFIDSYNLYNNLNIGYQLDYSYSKAKANEGLINDIGNTQALGLKLNMSYNTFGVFYDLPRKIVSGDIGFKVPTSRSINGDINYTNYDSDLSKGRFEQTFGVYKNFNNLFLKFSHTMNKDNNEDKKDNKILFNYNSQFSI